MIAFLKTLTGKIVVIGSLIGAITTLFINFKEFNKTIIDQNAPTANIDPIKTPTTTNNFIVLPNNKVDQKEIEQISENRVNEEVVFNTTKYLPNVTGRWNSQTGGYTEFTQNGNNVSFNDYNAFGFKTGSGSGNIVGNIIEIKATDNSFGIGVNYIGNFEVLNNGKTISGFISIPELGVNTPITLNKE